MNFVTDELAALDEKGLRRSLRVNQGGFINFSTNDYLNLSGHPHVKQSAVNAIELYGSGSGGSRLMTGNLPLHEEIENRLAELTGMEGALVFGSGFLANNGVLASLAKRNDLIFADRLNHASLVDGAIASGAAVYRYGHGDTGHLSELLSRNETSGRRFIVTDSLFSMDGDIAPLFELRKLATERDCMLIVDEAHAIGVFGNGAGLCSQAGIKADVITGTLSKALGSYGGFAASSGETREYLINRSRSFIYSTALPPASAGAAIGAMDVLEENPGMGEELLGRSEGFRKGMAAAGFGSSVSSSQIIPLYTGEPSRAVALSKSLEKAGILAVAVRPPTVPRGTSRLRFSITLSHTADQLSETLDILERSA